MLCPPRRVRSKTNIGCIYTPRSRSNAYICRTIASIAHKPDHLQASRISITISITTAKVCLCSSWSAADITEWSHYLRSTAAFGWKCHSNRTKKCSRRCSLCINRTKSHCRNFATGCKRTTTPNHLCTSTSILFTFATNIVSKLICFFLTHFHREIKNTSYNITNQFAIAKYFRVTLAFVTWFLHISIRKTMDTKRTVPFASFIAVFIFINSRRKKCHKWKHICNLKAEILEHIRDELDSIAFCGAKHKYYYINK